MRALDAFSRRAIPWLVVFNVGVVSIGIVYREIRLARAAVIDGVAQLKRSAVDGFERELACDACGAMLTDPPAATEDTDVDCRGWHHDYCAGSRTVRGAEISDGRMPITASNGEVCRMYVNDIVQRYPEMELRYASKYDKKPVQAGYPRGYTAEARLPFLGFTVVARGSGSADDVLNAPVSSPITVEWERGGP